MVRPQRLRHPKADDPKVIGTILRWIDGAVDALKAPLSPEMIAAGWDRSKRNEMLDLLRHWYDDISRANAIEPRHYKGIVRWFYDLDVDTTGVAETILQIDNQISRIVNDSTNDETVSQSKPLVDQKLPVLWFRRPD